MAIAHDHRTEFWFGRGFGIEPTFGLVVLRIKRSWVSRLTTVSLLHLRDVLPDRNFDPAAVALQRRSWLCNGLGLGLWCHSFYNGYIRCRRNGAADLDYMESADRSLGTCMRIVAATINCS